MEKGNIISESFKQLRKSVHITQKDFAIKSGLGLRFIRELEQGKLTLKLDKVLRAFSMFDYELVPMERKHDK